MIFRIMQQHSDSEWYWVLEKDSGDAVCRSENSKSIHGGYSRKATAVKSAERFYDNCFDEHIPIRVLDGFTGNIITEWNTYT